MAPGIRTQVFLVMSRHSTFALLGLLPLLLCVLQCSANDWWESAALYQIYPRSFQDSDGDGVGDLNGITSRLEYLKEIGITAAWISPIFESPMSDFGYDVSNFTRIDDTFGTLDDFDALIAKAKRLGVKILLDFVPNHSSDECEWFQKSIARIDGYDDFYTWVDGRVDPNNASNVLPPSNWISVFGRSQWTWNEQRQQFYLHQFQRKQPDLNYSNPMVHEHMLGVLKFWLDRGVDGFRIDAVPFFFEKRLENGTFPDEPLSGVTQDPTSYRYLDHIYTKDQNENVELLHEWRAFMDDYKQKNGGDTRVLIAEAYSPIQTLSSFIGNGTHNGTQVPMNFILMNLDGSSTARDMENLVNNWMNIMWTEHQHANWVMGNHDNPRVANRMGRQKVDLMNIIGNALPGVSVTYYGEEIGMADVPTECTEISCDTRDPERTPMQWTTQPQAGFTHGPNTWLPIAADYARYNVQTERGVARSSLNIFKRMQQLKTTNAFRAFKAENGFSYGAVSEQVFQIVRTAANREEYRILVNMGNKVEKLHNLANRVMEYVLLNAYSPHNYGDKVDLSADISLMPYEAVALRWLA